MRVKTWVETAQEVEVEVSIADMMSTISGLVEGDRMPMLIDCINCVYRVLREIPVAQIDLMTPKQRQVIGDALRVQADRFLKPNDGGNPQ
jgi:hypothetical protein